MSNRCFIPGDILTYSEYSGDARFVKITRVTTKTAYGRFMATKVVSDDGCGQNGYVVPNDIDYDSGEFRLGMIRDGYIWNGKENAYSSHWNGKPSHFYCD